MPITAGIDAIILGKNFESKTTTPIIAKRIKIDVIHVPPM